VGVTLNSGSDSLSHTPKQESGYIRSIGNQTVKEEDERRRIRCLDEIKIELRDVFVR
jgi:hypothetical protein